MRLECSKERVFCTHCRSPNHDTRICREHHNSTPSPTNSHIPTGYHPTATPPPLLGTAPATGTHPQQTGTTTNGPLFQNSFDTHQHTTDRVTTETTIETEDTSITQDMTKETKVTKTGMITIKIETRLTTEDDQINTSTTGTSQKHKSSSNTQIRTY